MDKTFFSRITIFLIAIAILFFVSGIGAKEIDANVWRIDNNSVWSSMPSYSYATDGNLTIDFNMASDTNFGYHYADINYSLYNTQGSGTPIIDGLIVDGNRCQTNFIGTWNNKPNSDPNLIGYWKFDAQEDDYNNIRAFDYSGNNNHGQYINGADNNSQGKWDTNATRFDAVTSNIKLGDPPLLEGMTQLTVSMWIYPIQNTKDLDLLVKGAHSIAQPFVFFYDEAITDHYGLLITDTGGATTGFKYSSAIPVINTWTHLAVTFKGDVNGNVLIYVNGALDANYSYPLVSDIKSTAANWTIGCDDGPCGSKAASGFIDEVKMWNRTLTPAEISLDYNLSKRNFRTCSQDWNIINVADANYYANVLVRDDVGNSDFNASYNNFRVNPSGEPPLNCGDTITTDTTMTEDLLGCTNNGITIGAEDVNLNCNGFTIDGNDTQSSNGVYTEYAGTTVKNCVVSDFGNGINVQAADNATISNNTTFSNITTGIRMFYTSNFSLVNDNNSYNNSYNLFVYTDHNITIKNNNLHDGNYGVWSTQDANLIAYSNKIYDNNVGWYLEDDAILYKNLIYNNYFSNAIHDFITTNPPGASSNHTNVYLPAPNGGHTMDWNTSNQTGTRIFGEGTNIGGNYYTNPDLNGYSNTCIDSQADGFCDSPYDVVDNNSCTIAASDCSINTDYLPLSDEYGAETDSCTCPASGWWNIINGDICTLATSCTLTSGGLHIIDGNLTILNTKQLTIPSTYHAIIEKGEKLYIEKGGKIVINK